MNFTAELVDVPSTFTDLEKTYYNKPCCYCSKTQLKVSAVCLLCGKLVCVRDRCQDFPEGMLCHHAKHEEGGQCIYLLTNTGQIILVADDGLVCDKLSSPYRTQFGECYSSSISNEDRASLKVDVEGGGAEYLREINQAFRTGGIPDMLVQGRLASNYVIPRNGA